MTQALYAHMNNKTIKKRKPTKCILYSASLILQKSEFANYYVSYYLLHKVFIYMCFKNKFTFYAFKNNFVKLNSPTISLRIYSIYTIFSRIFHELKVYLCIY
jgi:hypothetical protein